MHFNVHEKLMNHQSTFGEVLPKRAKSSNVYWSKHPSESIAINSRFILKFTKNCQIFTKNTENLHIKKTIVKIWSKPTQKSMLESTFPKLANYCGTSNFIEFWQLMKEMRKSNETEGIIQKNSFKNNLNRLEHPMYLSRARPKPCEIFLNYICKLSKTVGFLRKKYKNLPKTWK